MLDLSTASEYVKPVDGSTVSPSNVASPSYVFEILLAATVTITGILFTVICAPPTVLPLPIAGLTVATIYLPLSATTSFVEVFTSSLPAVVAAVPHLTDSILPANAAAMLLYVS